MWFEIRVIYAVLTCRLAQKRMAAPRGNSPTENAAACAARAERRVRAARALLGGRAIERGGRANNARPLICDATGAVRLPSLDCTQPRRRVLTVRAVRRLGLGAKPAQLRGQAALSPADLQLQRALKKRGGGDKPDAIGAAGRAVAKPSSAAARSDEEDDEDEDEGRTSRFRRARHAPCPCARTLR